MANLDSVFARYDPKAPDFRDKEWSDQFSNLTRMLDQYLVSAHPTSNMPDQNYSQQSSQFSISTDPFRHISPSEQPIAKNPIPYTNIAPSYTNATQNTYNFKVNLAINPTDRAGYSQNQRAARSQSPQEFFNPFKLQNQAQTSKQRMVSPQNTREYQSKKSRHISPTVTHQKFSDHRSPQNIQQEQAKPTKLFSTLGSHIDYGPRNRVPYGQAHSLLLSPHTDDLYQSPRYYPPQTTRQPQKKSNNFPTHMATSRDNTQSYLNSAGYSQKDYWISATNPYAKQKNNQKKNIVSSYSIQPNSHQQSNIHQDFHSQPQYSRVTNNLPSSRQGIQNHTAGFQNPSYSTLLSKITQKISSPPQYQISTNFESPRTAFTSINDFKVSLRSDLQPSTLRTGRTGIVTDQRIPNYLSASLDLNALGRKDSTEDLVGAHQQKFEQSVLLSKRAQEQLTEPEQDNSLLFNSQERHTLSKNRSSPHIPSPLGVSQIARDSIQTERKSFDKEPLAYQIVVEYYIDGTRFEGEKYSNKRHGRGSFYYREGLRYHGNWENGFMSGYGTLLSGQNQKIYEGGWLNNVFHGRGTLYNPEPQNKGDFNGTDFRLLKGSWTKFEGFFNAGQKQGLGTLLIANGDAFVGNFVRDVVHGRGSYTPMNGKPFIGLWRQNVLIDKY